MLESLRISLTDEALIGQLLRYLQKIGLENPLSREVTSEVEHAFETIWTSRRLYSQIPGGQ